jgi:U1 small nuclear ribonucleoprotein
MTDKLPPNLLALFAPRPALRWVPPSDHAPQERKTATIAGLAAFLPALEEYKEKDVYEPTESWLQRKDRLRLEKKETQERLLKEGPVHCESPLRGHCCCRYESVFGWGRRLICVIADNPQTDPNVRGDAFKTLIVARLSYDATEQDLEREFGRFGPIERVCYSTSSDSVGQI